MKNILSSLNKSEKNRIIEMHRKATRKNYLNEGVIISGGYGSFDIGKDLSSYANQKGSWSADENGETITLTDANNKTIFSINGSNYGKKGAADKQASVEKTNSFKPEEIVNFVKNGGPIEQSGKVITSNDNTKGYKFQNVDSAGNPVLRFLSGEGKALTIDANNKTFTFSERGGMSDQWSNKGTGRITFDGAKIGLWAK
jgi:hypothetical protein